MPIKTRRSYRRGTKKRTMRKKMRGGKHCGPFNAFCGGSKKMRGGDPGDSAGQPGSGWNRRGGSKKMRGGDPGYGTGNWKWP